MARLLCIEDDPDLQHLLGVALHAEGFEMHYAFTGVEGYEKVMGLNPDLVILDLMLPGMNGVEILQRMHSHQATRSIPVIVTTAYSGEAAFVERNIRSLGALEYMRKPVGISDLLRSIRRLLDGRTPREAPEEGPSRGVLRLEPRARTVWISDKLAATLPPKRFELMRLLVLGEGELTRAHLIEKLWGKAGSESALEKTVQRLREDLGEDHASRVQTTAKGYRLIA